MSKDINNNIYIDTITFNNNNHLIARTAAVHLQVDTSGLLDDTPFRGNAFAIPLKVALPYPRFPALWDQDTSLHGVPPTEETTKVARLILPCFRDWGLGLAFGVRDSAWGSQETPGAPRSAQELPGSPRSSHRSSQELPGAHSSCQELPGAPRSAQERPGAPRSSQQLPGVPRSSQELSGAPRSAQELPGALRSAQERPGAPRSSQELPAAPRSAQELPGALRRSQERPGAPMD